MGRSLTLETNEEFSILTVLEDIERLPIWLKEYQSRI